MAREFKYQSDVFNKVSDMENHKKLLINELCNFVGVPRHEFRLQRGTIALIGITHDNKQLRLTTKITDFPRHIKNKKMFKGFYLFTRLAVKK